ncbi:MAG TPA: hypothetical protein VFZ67_07190 [Nitrososphaera sp.]
MPEPKSNNNNIGYSCMMKFRLKIAKALAGKLCWWTITVPTRSHDRDAAEDDAIFDIPKS